jgi:hypothetical protein
MLLFYINVNQFYIKCCLARDEKECTVEYYGVVLLFIR